MLYFGPAAFASRSAKDGWLMSGWRSRFWPFEPTYASSPNRPHHGSSRCTLRLQFQLRGMPRPGSSESIEPQGTSADAAPPPGLPRLPFSYDELSANGGLLGSEKYRLPSGRS